MLTEAGGWTLAETIIAPIDVPHFDQSAMDGYAFAFDGWDGNADLTVTGIVQTGARYTNPIRPQEAVRIYTGAALPKGTDTVVIQENVERVDNQIRIKDSKLRKGSNVREKGSQTKKGFPILNPGHLLTPASVALIAGFGLDRVTVFSQPVVSIIATGKELVSPGNLLDDAQIFESNTFGLNAALKQIGIQPVSVEMIDDDETKISNAIERQLGSDILILTGGVSVGDYDFVTAALEKCAVKKIFHKVKQKPGKPFFFGKHQNTLVFGLPGNPASVLTCFYEYVADTISLITGKIFFKKVQLPLLDTFTKKPGLTFFLKGKTLSDGVKILTDQESYKLNSFAEADCIIELEETQELFQIGDRVSVRMIT